MEHSSRDSKFSITTRKSSKLSSANLLKSMLKMLLSDLNKRGLIFKFCIYIQTAAILVSQGLTS